MKNLIIIPVLFCLMLATLTAQTATLSGKITRLDATPVSGITVELINTDNLVLATDQTNAQGMYSFEQLNTGQTYTVKPQDNG
ncbi:MAG: carboxypeptidase regulatory-like domain-containing protein, partial [Mameliella sp.]|nr:carboxypeptidase regulatory-like domain-containing protein [Phaeodactylibacter sp.]